MSIPAVSRFVRHGGWVVMAIAEQWQFAVNALFHLAAWITLGDYAVGTAGPWAAATVDLAGELVGRDGIEPPTLRFSAARSTD